MKGNRLSRLVGGPAWLEVATRRSWARRRSRRASPMSARPTPLPRHEGSTEMAYSSPTSSASAFRTGSTVVNLQIVASATATVFRNRILRRRG